MSDKHDLKTVSPETPFLSSDEDRENSLSGYEESKGSRYERSWCKRHRSAILFHSLMMLFYLSLTVTFWRNLTSHKNLLFTPVQDYIERTVIVIPDSPADIQASEYVGEPSPELDAAWYRLLRHHNIRITEAELRAMNQTSIPLGHGGGYQGMMAVFHELHCLKLIREAVHSEYYYKDKSENEKAILVGHTEHCIDILRAGAMCRADTAIFPYHWSDATRLPNPTWVQKHECINWNRLEEWLESRRIDILTPGMLVHPKYGPAYPGGKRISEPDGPRPLPLDE